MKKLILIGSLLASQLAYANDILIDKRLPNNAQNNNLGKKQVKNRSVIQQGIYTQNTMSLNLNSFHKEELVDPNEVIKAQQNLEDLQKSLYSQQLALKKKREEYENAQSDFFQALNDKSKLLVKKEEEISGLGLELSVGLDKIENTKKELENAINKYRNKYQDLAQFEKALQDKEQHLAQLENNLANQDIILITKTEKVDSLVEEVSTKTSIVEKQKEQLNEQANEILKLKKELAKQQAQPIKKLYDIKKYEVKNKINPPELNSVLKNNTVKKTAITNVETKQVKKSVTTNKQSLEKNLEKTQSTEEYKEEKAKINFKNQMTYSDKAAKTLDFNDLLLPKDNKNSLIQNTLNLFSTTKN